MHVLLLYFFNDLRRYLSIREIELYIENQRMASRRARARPICNVVFGCTQMAHNALHNQNQNKNHSIYRIECGLEHVVVWWGDELQSELELCAAVVVFF